MTFLHCPAQLPDGMRYYLRSAQDCTLIRDLLQRIRPGSACCGTIGPDERPADDLAIVNLEPDWRDADDGRVLHLLIPEANHWGWARYAAKALHTVGKGGRTTAAGGELLALMHAGDIHWRRHYLSSFSRQLQAFRPFIKRVYDALADDASRQLYSMVFGGAPEDICTYYASRIFTSYQYGDHVRIGPGDVILNCGVFEGFEIPYFLSYLQNTGSVIDIDPMGHGHLSRYAAGCIGQAGNVVEEKCAVANVSGTLTLSVLPDGQMQNIVSDKTISCPSTSIDDLVAARGLARVDLVKMDIEGEEYRACLGMENTIKRFRPQLAISIYHSINHFWEVPLILMNMCENYDFHIGHYSCTRHETIFYAIPKEKTVPTA